jgi:hypothetical protein
LPRKGVQLSSRLRSSACLHRVRVATETIRVTRNVASQGREGSASATRRQNGDNGITGDRALRGIQCPGRRGTFGELGARSVLLPTGRQSMTTLVRRCCALRAHARHPGDQGRMRRFSTRRGGTGMTSSSSQDDLGSGSTRSVAARSMTPLLRSSRASPGRRRRRREPRSVVFALRRAGLEVLGGTERRGCARDRADHTSRDGRVRHGDARHVRHRCRAAPALASGDRHPSGPPDDQVRRPIHGH